MSDALHLIGVLGNNVVWAIGVVAIVAAFLAAPRLYGWLAALERRVQALETAQAKHLGGKAAAHKWANARHYRAQGIRRS
jgi:hypothetical protein